MTTIPEALGIAWQSFQAGQLPQAEHIFRQILQADRNQVDALHMMGILALQTGRVGLAVDYLQAALHVRPDFAEAHNNLGMAFQAQGKFAEAVPYHQEAVRLQPDFAEAHSNLGRAFQELGKRADAVQSYQHATRLQPDSAELHYNLATALRQQGKLADAGVSLQTALRLKPDFAWAHHELGILWLLQGDFERGGSEYEWRWLMPEEYPSPPRPGPRWDGGALLGKTILLYPEQGVGDTIQFIRYATVVKERGATVVVECPAPLLGVLAGCPGVDRFLPQGVPLPAYDVQAPLVSLPGLCRTTLATIPARVPYLVADRTRVTHWQQRLTEFPGIKVGICWQGNPCHNNDRWRSAPLARFAPLAEIPGVRLVCLQKGPGREQWDTVSGQWPTVELLNQEEEPSRAWAETAALLCALDLVITVDTAVAHLAGALGVPAWVALPFAPDWRWLLEREDSPWYPSMRLFRQTQLGDWGDVFLRIKEALQAREYRA
jgi:Tfp pilus assembly protein PilF